jgi:hypothetical protein
MGMVPEVACGRQLKTFDGQEIARLRRSGQLHGMELIRSGYTLVRIDCIGRAFSKRQPGVDKYIEKLWPHLKNPLVSST